MKNSQAAKPRPISTPSRPDQPRQAAHHPGSTKAPKRRRSATQTRLMLDGLPNIKPSTPVTHTGANHAGRWSTRKES